MVYGLEFDMWTSLDITGFWFLVCNLGQNAVPHVNPQFPSDTPYTGMATETLRWGWGGATESLSYTCPPILHGPS